MPIKKNAQLLLISTIAFGLISCGGSSDANDNLIYEIPELRLNSISISNNEIEYNDDDLDFDADITGLYEITVNSTTDYVDVLLDVSDDAKEGTTSYLHSSTDTYKSEDLEDGFDFSIELDEGSNLLSIFLEDESGLLPLSYLFNIYKAYSTAKLTDIELYEFPSDQSSETTLSPSFSSSTYDYISYVPYDSCAVVSVPYANASATTIKHQDDELSSGDVLYQNLEVGRNYVDIFALSEDGERERRYSIEVQRAEPEDDERLENANLKTLEISSGELNYICGFYAYSTSVNSDVSSIDIDLSTEVEGAEVWINGLRVDEEDTNTITIDSDTVSTLIQVISASGNTVNSYSLSFERLDRNYIKVENIAEFAAAFKNARPNDYIELAEGDYDISELAESELDNGSLTSGSSGSRLEPIVISPEDGAEVNFFGSEIENASILKFTGSHWKIIDLDLSDSDYGISLYNSENIDMSGIEFHDLTIGGIHSSGGTGNTVRLSQFEDIGADQEISYIIEIDDESQFESLQNTFILAPSNTAIRISDDSSESEIKSNLFAHTESLTELNHSVIIGGGDKTQITYNHFDLNIYAFSTSLVQYSEYSGENPEGIYIYENRITDIDSDINFVESAFSPTYIQLPDHTPDNILLSGSDIQDGWSIPSYQIQLEESPQFCLGLYQDPDYDDDELRFVALKTCDGSEEQSWEIEIGDTAPYVQIKNLSIELNDDDEELSYITTLYSFYQYCSGDSYQGTVYLDEQSEGTFIQRWLLDTSDDQTLIRSKSIFGYGLTAQGTSHTEEQTIGVCSIGSSNSHSFLFNQL